MLKPITAATFGLVCCVLSACGSTQRFRDAQDHFNAASAAETTASLETTAGFGAPAGLNIYSPALTNYRLALALVEASLKEDRNELDSDNLTGTAEALHCIILWRVSDLDPPSVPPPPLERTDSQRVAAKCATDAAQDAADGRIKLGTRDTVMLDVLPYFIDLDVARTTMVTQDNYPKVKTFLDDVRKHLGDALKKLPSSHDMAVYLRLARIRTLRSERGVILKRYGEAAVVDTSNDGHPALLQNRKDLIGAACELRLSFPQNAGLQEFLRMELLSSGITVPSPNDCPKPNAKVFQTLSFA